MELNGQNFQNNSNGYGNMNMNPSQQGMNSNPNMGMGNINNGPDFNSANAGGQQQGFGGVTFNNGMNNGQANMGGYSNGYNQNTNMYNQGYNGMQQPYKKPVLGLISLILAILSIVICCFTPWFAIPAIVIGVIAIFKDRTDKKAIAGIAVAAVALVITIVLNLALGGIGTLLEDVINSELNYEDDYDYEDNEDGNTDDDLDDDYYYDEDDIHENLDDSESEEESEVESEVESETEDTDDYTPELPSTPVGGVTSNSSTDWRDLKIVFEGVEYTLPFDYSLIKANGWSFDIADYGYPDGYIMNSMNKVSSTIDLTKAEYTYEDSWDNIEVGVGFQNLGTKAVDIYETSIWAFELDVANSKGEFDDKYPSLLLAKDITWGSKYHNIIAAYGEPNETYEAEELGYTVLTYDTWDEDDREVVCKMRLYVYKDTGLTHVDIQAIQ